MYEVYKREDGWQWGEDRLCIEMMSDRANTQWSRRLRAEENQCRTNQMALVYSWPIKEREREGDQLQSQMRELSVGQLTYPLPFYVILSIFRQRPDRRSWRIMSSSSSGLKRTCWPYKIGYLQLTVPSMLAWLLDYRPLTCLMSMR